MLLMTEKHTWPDTKISSSNGSAIQLLEFVDAFPNAAIAFSFTSNNLIANEVIITIITVVVLIGRNRFFNLMDQIQVRDI